MRATPMGCAGIPTMISIPAYVAVLNGSYPRSDGKYIFRFGRKGAVYDLVQQVALAYNHDMGVSFHLSALQSFQLFGSDGP